MKIAKQMQRKPSSPQKFVFLDEMHLMTNSPAYTAALQKWQSDIRKPNAASIATQAIMRFNSGKRLRFLGSMKRADGSPLKPSPQKFIPVQVLRRRAA